MTQKALVGAGCFWGVQAYFDEVPGVIKTTVGYAGGHVNNPTYDQVWMHTTGHAEVIEIEFDDSQLAYRDVLRHFFRMHDPTQLNRQGPDVGDNYRSVIFYYNDEQKKIAKEVKEQIQSNFDKPVVTETSQATTFYAAEEEHQKFFQKTGIGACHIPYAPLKTES